jgi:hypothetical protein
MRSLSVKDSKIPDLGWITGKPEVNCCYPAFALRTRINGQKQNGDS